MFVKDADGVVKKELHLIDHTLSLISSLNPHWWVLENPVGRLPKLRPVSLGKAELVFQPCWYGDPYNKKTCLWGTFNFNLKRTDVEPGAFKYMNRRAFKSVTPTGFSTAFFNANR